MWKSEQTSPSVVNSEVAACIKNKQGGGGGGNPPQNLPAGLLRVEHRAVH